MGVDVARELTATERRVLGVLRGRPVRVRVRIGYDVVRETGIGGATQLNTSIDLSVSPEPPVGTRTSPRVWLPFVLAHELDHAVRSQDGPGLAPRMIDYFVREGVAEDFAAAMFPSAPPVPTLQGLTPKEIRHYWRRAQGILYSNPDQLERDEWLFGGGGFPRNTVYAIGSALIRSFRAHHPNVSWAKLTRLDSETIVEESHFRP